MSHVVVWRSLFHPISSLHFISCRDGRKSQRRRFSADDASDVAQLLVALSCLAVLLRVGEWNVVRCGALREGVVDDINLMCTC